MPAIKRASLCFSSSNPNTREEERKKRKKNKNPKSQFADTCIKKLHYDRLPKLCIKDRLH